MDQPLPHHVSRLLTLSFSSYYPPFLCPSLPSMILSSHPPSLPSILPLFSPLSSFYYSILRSSFSPLYPPFLLFPLSSLPPSLCPLLTSPSLPSFPWFRLQPAIACLPGSSRTLSYIPFSFAIEVVAPPLHDGTNTIFTTTLIEYMS